MATSANHAGIRRAYSVLTIKSIDDERRIIEGVATTPTPDRLGDIVEPKGAKFSLPLPLLWQHSAHEPIGHVLAANVTDSGIAVKARIAKGVLPQIDEAWALIKSGLVRGLSIGFRATEDPEPINPKEPWGALRFKAWEWLELSAVTIPANAEANIQTIKSAYDADRAALGLKVTAMQTRSVLNRPGASGHFTQPKGRNMKSYAQQLADLQATRTEKQSRVKELAEGAGDDINSLGADEAAEYDSLIAEVRSLDLNISRVRGTIQTLDGAHEVPADAGIDPEKAARARGTVYREPKAPPLEKGIALAQYLRLLGRCKGNIMHAQAMAQNVQGLDPRVPRMLKTAVEAGSAAAGTTTAGNWGMELVGTETSAFADFVDFLRPMTILGKFGAGVVPNLRRVPFRVPLVGMTDGGSGYWVGEGKAKPLTKFGFSRTHLEPLKVAAITVATRELIMDSSPAADGLLRDALAAALRERTDIDFIDPGHAGSPGVSPDSITKNATPIPATGTGDAADIRTDIKAAFGQFIAANNAPTSGVWIMSSRTALSTALLMNPLGQPEFPQITMNGGTLSGLPVITSEYVPDDSNGGTVVLVNAQDIYFGDDGGIVIDTSEHASLLMDTAPSGMDSITPSDAQLVSMYQTNSVAYRAERRLDWMLRRPTAVVVLSGVNWGTA